MKNPCMYNGKIKKGPLHVLGKNEESIHEFFVFDAKRSFRTKRPYYEWCNCSYAKNEQDAAISSFCMARTKNKLKIIVFKI